jgi:hypothetical protein
MRLSKHSSGSLSGFRSYRVPSRVTPEVIERFLQSLDCPRALTVWLMFREKEHDQLVELAFNPSDYCGLVATRDAYMATKFLSKFEDFSLDLDLDAVAFAKFRETELRCRLVNRRFRTDGDDPLFKGRLVWLHNAVKQKIHRILSDYDPVELFESPDWGPGASTRIKRRDASPQQKFQCETGITRDLFDLVAAPMAVAYPLWFSHLVEVSFPDFDTGNKVITVPKDSSSNRVIAVEPGINLWFQKSIGDMIKRRLLLWGVDLRYQENNQHLAYMGSKDSMLATVDFSSASDTISASVVEALLPQRWFNLLDSARSHYGMLDGSWVKWEKFSSMGNGFTFPLESLIFHACALACVEYLGADTSSVSTYGDDVIIPSVAFELYTELTDFYGFQVNPKKSHVKGLFRESCGAHYYSGFDIKPVYFRSTLTGIETVYRLSNAFRRLAKRQGKLCCDVRFKECVDHLVRSVPAALRLKVPEGFGDGGFISNFDEATPPRYVMNPSKGFGWEFKQYGPVGFAHADERFGYELTELWRIANRPRSFETEPVTPGYFRLIREYLGVAAMLKAIEELTEREEMFKGRNSVLGHRTVFRFFKSVARQWTDLGPWL